MTMHARRRFLALLSVLFLFVSGCASDGGKEEVDTPKQGRTSGQFYVPPELEENVDFWRNVYSKWSRGQVAFHDDEHLGLIYEVESLPGPTLASYTPEQRSFVRSRKDFLSYRLKELQRKVTTGQSLSSADRALRDKITDAAGSGALYGAHDRVRSQRGLRERFRRGVEISGRYDEAFRDIFRAKGLPEDLAYLPHVESSFQTSARSSAGAAGVWQFTRGTGKLYMTVNRAVDERLDPVVAADGAARYLRDAYGRLGSWPIAVTSYNHGMAGMRKAKDLYGDDLGRIVRHYKGRYFGFASRNFYAEFLAAREIASNPTKFFPEGIRYQEPLSEDRLVLRYSMPADHVARHYGVSVYRLADLNLSWRKAARSGDAYLPAGTAVWLPAGSLKRVANAPRPVPREPVSVAKAERPPKAREPVILAKADRPTRSVKRAKAKAKPRARKAAQHHVVAPNETLYRVSVKYDVPVVKLRKLNRMAPDDNNISPGQRLRVSGG